MRASLRFAVAVIALSVIALVLGAQPSMAQGFKHPGVMLDKAQLDYMKAMVNGHVEPFYSTFLKAQNSAWGSLTYVPKGPPAGGWIQCGSTSNPDIGCHAADDDASAAYLQALLWYITGNQAYANNSIMIMNTYSQNMKGYVGFTPGSTCPGASSTCSNGPLQAAWDAEKWPRAAEIIRYTNAGWSDADAQAFGNLMTTLMLPLIKNGSTSNGNWEISMIEGLIGIGVYNNDATTFNTGVTYWRQRTPAYFYYHTDGAQPVPSPRGTASWYGQTVFDPTVDGISQETCRDFGHAQYGLAGTLNAAETARIQGIDLYSEQKDRLIASLEFNAYYLSGNPIPTTVCGGAPTLQVYPIDEIGYNEYHNRLGSSLPNTLAYLNKTIRKLSDPTENHMMVYESLSHGGDASNMPAFLFWSAPSAATVWVGKSVSYTINVVPGSDASAIASFSVSGLPQGATYAFLPETVTGSGSTTLTVTAGSSTPAGTYAFTVTGTSGSATYTNTLNLTVNPEAADFTISVSPDPVTAVVGDTSTITVRLNPKSGYIGTATPSVTAGLPTAATASFSPSTISPANPTSTLSITTPGTTAPGAYTITVAANDQTVTRETTALLILNPISSGCIQQLGNYWITGDFPSQAGTFTAEWDATPSTAVNNSNVGLSLGAQSAFTGLAVAARFYTDGTISARNGGAFASDNVIRYSAGVSYHFRAVVNVAAGTYSLYVTSAGQSEITVGTNYAFRSEQTGITSIDHWDAISQAGTISLCNVTIDTNDFSLSVTPSAQSITAGTSTTFVAAVESGTGYSGSVSLSVSGLPTGATGSFNPSAITNNGSSTLMITTTASVATGTYPLTVTATDGTNTRVSYVALTVNAACQVPTVLSQNVSAPVNGFAAVTLSGSLGAFCSSSDTLTYATTQPSHGRLDGTAPNLIYTPTAGYVGSDSFTYTATDGNAVPTTSTPATVSITVTAPTSGAPTISGLSPAFAAAGSTAMTLTVNGNGFVTGSVVRFNGQDLATTFVNATQLTAAVPATALATVGTADVTVFVPGANGGVSAVMKFGIDTSSATNGRPSVTAGSGTLTIAHGKNGSLTLSFSNVGSDATVTVACYNLPAGANCSYSSDSKNLSITTSTSTPVGNSQVLLVCNVNRTQSALATRGFGAVFYGSFLMPLGFVLFGNRRKRALRYVFGCIALLLLLAAIGCGGGGQKPPTTPSTVGGQTSTTITLTVS